MSVWDLDLWFNISIVHYYECMRIET